MAAYWSGKPLLQHESRLRPIFTSANSAIWWWNANRKLDYVTKVLAYRNHEAPVLVSKGAVGVAELLVFALPARPPPEQKEAQRPAIGVFEVVMVFVVVIERASHRRPGEVMRVRIPVPPPALPLFTLLTRHLLPPRLFAEPSLAVQRLISAVACTERSIGFCAGLDVTAA